MTPAGEAMWPVWSLDGRQIAFTWHGGWGFWLTTTPADSNVPILPRPLTRSRELLFPFSFSPDGHILAVRGYDDIVMVTREGNVEPKIATPKIWERGPALSRNGRWLAYGSDTTGRMEVYVTSYPDIRTAGTKQVSVDGGENPAWHPNGRELFFVSPLDATTGKRRMMSVKFDPGRPFPPGRPAEVFAFEPEKLLFTSLLRPHEVGSELLFANLLRPYDVGSDGRFYGVEAGPLRSTPVVKHIDLILNWLADLKAKVPRRK